MSDLGKDQEKTYIAIDLKSFYASVECMERGLDPLDTNLVVADPSRTEKTICLAVSPSLKAYGISGRARLFEVVSKLKRINEGRRQRTPGKCLQGFSCSDQELKAHPEKEIRYLVAPPRMAYYIQYSTKIYNIYLKYIAPEDMHVYSIDEVFIDATHYLNTYRMTAKELAMTMIKDVLRETGITATAGIGSNLYLCKIAMDIMAKKSQPDEDGVRIASLDERSYREQLWSHRPLTDFWRVGKGYASKLENHGLYTMGDIARCSTFNEELLYRLFGINAELLIDHAWGWEPCTMEDIRSYKPENSSICSGQVLQTPYSSEKARVVVHEMADALGLDLVEKGLVSDQIVLTIGYDRINLEDPELRSRYHGPVAGNRYGIQVPKHAHGSGQIGQYTSSSMLISRAVLELYDRLVNPDLLIRRLTMSAEHVIEEEEAKRKQKNVYEQLSLFTDYEALQKEKEKERKQLEKERKLQEAMLSIKKKYGKNAVLKGTSFEEGATGQQRNTQIGGHKA